MDLRPTTSHTSSSEIATLPDDYLDAYGMCYPPPCLTFTLELASRTISWGHDINQRVPKRRNADIGALTKATMANDESTTAQDRRRSRTGISLYIRNTLNRRRMRDATPEERIAALRRLRTNNGTDESAPHTGNRRSNRLSARFSGVGFGNSRRASTVTQESIG